MRPRQCEQAKALREDERLRFLAWRAIEPDEACETCGGAGTRVYGSTATFWGGIGGAAMTNGICDKCWGSGNKVRTWLNLKSLRSDQQSRINCLKAEVKGLQAECTRLRVVARWNAERRASEVV